MIFIILCDFIKNWLLIFNGHKVYKWIIVFYSFHKTEKILK